MSGLRPLEDRISALHLRKRAHPFVFLDANKKGEPCGSPKIMVGMRGLEPPRCHHHRLLRPARLPVPPHPRGVRIYEPCHGVSRLGPLKLSQTNSHPEPIASVSLAVPVGVVSISRVGPGVSVSIGEVRLRIAVRVIPVRIIR